jgi:copper(I)-binding protein
VFRLDTPRAATTRFGLAGLTGLATGALVLASALAGCGAGQVSQVATQQPAVNGTAGSVGPIALRNVHIQAVQKGDALEPGSEVDLVFVAVNNSPDVNDRLVGITSEVGPVAVSGPTALPAAGSLGVGVPDGVEKPSAVEDTTVSAAIVALTKPIRNGLTYPFTFTFEKAGTTTLAVPISAGNAPRHAAS